MSLFRFNQTPIDSNLNNFQAVLARAYQQNVRPFCLCKPDGIEMYIAKINEQYVIKRMPNTGKQHSINCDSYEVPAELSGLAQMNGTAITESKEDGTTTLKLAFSLSKGAGKAIQRQTQQEKDSVKTDGTKLTLRGTLHYLFEQAGFNRYTPAMRGKRSWFVIRKYLLQAANDTLVKNSELSSLLYIPEAFSLEKKEEITQRRQQAFQPLLQSTSSSRKLMIAIGEVKSIEPSRYGHKLIFKHLHDCPFMLAEDIYKRLQKRFSNELALWDMLETSHLMAIATFGLSPAGIVNVEEIALMVVSEDWLPFDNNTEYALLSHLIEHERKFIKSLRYNLSIDKAIAFAVLTDTGDTPTALYITNPDKPELHEQIEEMINISTFTPWVWNYTDIMPALPLVIQKESYHAQNPVSY